MAPRRDQVPSADQSQVEHGGTTEPKPRSASASMAQAGAGGNAAIDMFAKFAKNPDTEKKPVMVARSEQYGLNPKYLRHNVWDEKSVSLPFSMSQWTETARPLAYIPTAELDNPIASHTICHNTDLFKIVMPINVDKFESLLQNHPNPLFVVSVCNGLREGFWPWADTLRDGYPATHNASYPTPLEEHKSAFLRAQ
ncbi:hypothetical protein HYPSUDRAFT_206414 [Hypholoma sublateritium FD-334 SS-4]|uniref:Uncharacterized protein n=1 Tax=Hypholoma sublateritium (strain FD-334 SS-4) TaxID=945553 RepID=A0A0D2KR73_HYPSF|nr:hypothetical protein HYPSUDRAFT_206414 [Hypholoma sublateritium FD-334 SS-4]